MIWKSTIIKGKLTGITTRHMACDKIEPGIPTLLLRSEDVTYLCPTTEAFIDGLNLFERVGQNVIVGAMLNADGRLIDTMTLLMEP